MLKLFLIVGGLALAAGATAHERGAKRKAASSPPGTEAGKSAKAAPTADELKAAGRAEALAEVKAAKAKERELERAVKRAMRVSPRARVVTDDEGDE